MPTSQDEFYRGLECAGDALARAEDRHAARAKAVHDAVTPLLRDNDEHGKLACRSGCAHCCHFPVGVTFAEAVRLADAIRHDAELAAHVLQQAEPCESVTWTELVGTPCPMLRDGACVRYDERPMPCRALGSLDDNACEQSLTTATVVPRDEAAWWRGLGAARALTDEHGSRELRSAVAALLRADETEWPQAFGAARPTP